MEDLASSAPVASATALLTRRKISSNCLYRGNYSVGILYDSIREAFATGHRREIVSFKLNHV